MFKIEELKKINSETYILANLILFLIFLFGGMTIYEYGYTYTGIVCGGFSFVFGFNFHDCIDYGRRFSKLGRILSSEIGDITDRSETAYRIEQWFIMLLLSIAIWALISPWAVLWGFIMWQFCVADFMFYIVLKVPIVEMRYDWLENWSVIAAIIKPVGKWKFIVMSITGILLPLIWGILLITNK